MFNLIILQGRITHTPELKKTTNGISVMSFSIAHDYYNTNKEKETYFFNCVAWRSTAEFIERYFCKGQDIGIQGELKPRTYTDRNGNKKTVYEVYVEKVHFIGGKEEKPTDGEFEGNNEGISEEAEEYTEIEDNSDDDLPF